MEIIKYVPSRDLLGRFKPSKKQLAKTMFVALALISMVTNYYMAKMVFNLRCQVNGQVVGWFTTKSMCHQISTSEFDRMEAERQLRVISWEN